ncbi:MAG: hypothetical protein II994_08825 [Lachnospiraceae bacterium]|nr:hypothetical protein [Lachnospiraceae bacterium]
MKKVVIVAGVVILLVVGSLVFVGIRRNNSREPVSTAPDTVVVENTATTESTVSTESTNSPEANPTGDILPDINIVDGKVSFDENTDTDGDGMPDQYELYVLYPTLLRSGYDESEGMKPDHDYDQDGLTSLEEYLADTHPGNADTDGDGISDYAELREYGTDPLSFN